MKVTILLLIGVFLVAAPAKAEAYLDPGTGSYVLQIAAATFFASLFIAKAWWGHIRHFIMGMVARKDKHSSEKSSKKDK